MTDRKPVLAALFALALGGLGVGGYVAHDPRQVVRARRMLEGGLEQIFPVVIGMVQTISDLADGGAGALAPESVEQRMQTSQAEERRLNELRLANFFGATWIDADLKRAVDATCGESRSTDPGTCTKRGIAVLEEREAFERSQRALFTWVGFSGVVPLLFGVIGLLRGRKR